MSLYTELKRRNVFRVAAAYVVLAWLLIEVAETVLPIFEVPGAFLRGIVIMVILGFPLALFLAWAYELTPQGIKRTVEVDPLESITRLTRRKLDFVIIGLMAVALAYFVVDKFVFTARPVETLAESAATREASIAVLPFSDMSAAGDQEYFGDGLAEEILNLLAGVSELKVSGRTSSFSFKGKDTPIPEIGRALGVAHVLEGSVRKSGDRLRITAQLVNTEDGFHLWSETFDRQLADIFAIQDEIAGAIAAALKLTLVGEAAGAGNLEAYDLYLQARSLVYSRNPQSLREARRLIDRALELDPDYAPAAAASGELWQLLSDDVNSYGDIPVAMASAAARKDLQRALHLDPAHADTHAALGLLFLNLGDHAAAEGHLTRALAINPSLTNANHWYVLNLSRSGRARDSVAASRRFAELDPLFVTNLGNQVIHLMVVGDYAAAERLGQQLQRSYPDRSRPSAVLAIANSFQGKLAIARGAIDRALALEPESAFNRWTAEIIHYKLGDCDAALRVSTGWTEAQCLVSMGRDAEGLERVRARIEAAPDGLTAIWGWLHGLALSGRHEELLAWVDQRRYGPAELRSLMPVDISQGGGLSPLAEAQRAMGRVPQLAETLAHWGETLAFLEGNGYATGDFRFWQASHAALSNEREAALARLGEAIDLGFRDPLLARAPAFAPWQDDPQFQAQLERMRELINIERASLGMEPLE